MSRGVAPVFSQAQCKAIAARYDGTTQTLEQLLREFAKSLRGIKHKRVLVARAAQKGGYRSRRQRVDWTAERDQWLCDNYGKKPARELCAYLGCTPLAMYLRSKRLKLSTRNNTDFTIYDLEHLCKLDHRQWHSFIERGWLKSYDEYAGVSNKVWSRRVKIEWLLAFLREHPEALNYRAAAKYTRAVLELDKLPDPPKFMRVTCASDSWKDGARLTPTGFKVHHGEVELVKREHRYDLRSCKEEGGTDFWAPPYKNPNCPRCGCVCSRFSDKALYTDEDPEAGETLNAVAGKLGLVYRRGRFYTEAGELVSQEDLLRFVFGTKRNAGKAFSTFRKLLQAGLTVAPPIPVPAARILPNILDFELRAGAQRAAWDAFLKSGNVGVYWPPGIGKMYFLGTAFTRLAGEHFLFVHTVTIREQWLAFFREHAPKIKESGFYSATSIGRKQPYYRVDIYDHAGALRSTVRIYTYLTRASFARERPVVVGYDEAQFLPGNNASRLSMIAREFSVGLSATPFREDGRADLIQIMTGEALGEDWKPFKDSGEIPDVPVRVVLVNDLEHKYQALGRTLNGHRTIVFSDAIADGKRIEAEFGIPFIHAETKNRLDILGAHKAVCMSRVGDCGLDVQDLEEVIEFNFHHGSRAQSLQRLGRLLHSRKQQLRHTVLMTLKEFSLYHKRLSALEAKGFKLRIEMWQGRIRRGRPPAALPVRSWLQALGMRPQPAPRAVNRVTGKLYETNAQKQKRVARSVAERIRRAA